MIPERPEDKDRRMKIEEDILRDEAIALEIFRQQLEQHDWYYEFSDDHRVWKRGVQERETLERLSHTSPEHRALFLQYKDRYFNKAYGFPKERA